MSQKEIIEALQAVRGEVKSIKHDEKNLHGGYTYVSIDTYYDRIASVATKHGLVWRTKELEFSFLEGQGKNKDRTYIKARFGYDLFKGEQSFPDFMAVTICSPLDGAQTTGILYSYADKVFMRVAFCVPTGEKDADATVSEPMSVRSTPHDPLTGEVLEKPKAPEPKADPKPSPPEGDGLAIEGEGGFPVLNNKKVSPESIAMIEGIFKTWMPAVKTKAKLTDWHALNVPAMEAVKPHDPMAYDRIKELFRERFRQLK